jgi:hypothetical protein
VDHPAPPAAEIAIGAYRAVAEDAPGFVGEDALPERLVDQDAVRRFGRSGHGQGSLPR